MKCLLIIAFNCAFLLQLWGNKADSLKTILNETANPYTKVMVLLKISDLYEFSDPALSKDYVIKALKIAESNSKKGKVYSFRRLEGICHYYLGILEKHIANYTASLSDYEKSLRLFEEITNTFPDSAQKTRIDRANVLNAIGNLHLLYRNYSKALSFFKEVLVLYEAEKDTIKIAGTLMSIGAVYEHSNLLDDALKNYILSLNFYKLKKHSKFAAVCLNNMGNVYKQQSKFTLADSVYMISLLNRRQTNDVKGASIVLNNLSELRLLMGNYKEAIAFGEESLQKAGEVGNLSTMLHTYENISKAQANLGNYKAAFENQLQLRMVNDSILGLEKQKALLEFQQKYESLLKEKENVLLREKLIRRKFYTTILGASLAVVASILMLMLFISRSRNRILQQKQALLAKEQQLSDLALKQQQEVTELKSKELSALTLHMINKNETLNNLKNQLNEINNSGDTTNVNSILNSINSNFQLDDDWQKFKLHFEAVNNQFFDKLSINYPNLTPYEIKLCVYLKIGLTSKEISQMLNTSIDAVSKARQRLRKKLNIESETDLAIHFHSF